MQHFWYATIRDFIGRRGWNWRCLVRCVSLHGTQFFGHIGNCRVNNYHSKTKVICRSVQSLHTNIWYSLGTLTFKASHVSQLLHTLLTIVIVLFHLQIEVYAQTQCKLTVNLIDTPTPGNPRDKWNHVGKCDPMSSWGLSGQLINRFFWFRGQC